LHYAKDAFDGLGIMANIVEGVEEAVPSKPKPAEPGAGRAVAAGGSATAVAEPVSTQRSEVAADVPIPSPPFWGARVIENVPVKACLGFINETMLFQVQWGYKKKGRPQDEFDRYIDTEVRPIYRKLVERCQEENILQPRAVYGYWPCQSEGNTLFIYDPDDRERVLCEFDFPRQTKKPFWCLADFWRPRSSGEFDVIAMTMVTMGQQVSDIARQWFEQDKYLDYLHLHGLGVEGAEALAEYLHKQVRMELGIAEHDARNVTDLFKQKYQGSRYSFGYPACPNLQDQEKMWPLLEPERIGITLSEEWQLDPEQSTSAVVAHHPEARYFKA
jgi:5-methyltetrahydrofolate--homocysteine methyltransferase